ncbi:MAG: OmpA family protein, partial [Saprospiraceae bacterium]
RLYLASNIFSRYDIIADTLAVYAKEIGFVSDQSLSVKSDGRGNMWVGTRNHGMFRFRLYFKEAEEEELPEEIEFSAIVFSETTLKCAEDNDGSLNVRATGGTEPYTYKWSDPKLKGKNPKGLTAETYSLTVTDAKGQTKELSAMVQAPQPLTIQVLKNQNISRVNARDGELQIQAIGGTGEMKYKWADGSIEAERKRLKQGDYAVTVTDENGCSASLEVEVKGVKILEELVVEEMKKGQTIRIDQLYFQADSLVFEEASIPVLKELKEFLKTNPKVRVEIGGHTNGLPSHKYCDWLSNGRAENVANYLYNQGISTAQVSFKGYGKREPVADNKSKQNRQKNQRVEVKVVEVE